jgi:hypothetical protein
MQSRASLLLLFFSLQVVADDLTPDALWTAAPPFIPIACTFI